MSPRPPDTDPLEHRFRMDSVPAGAWVTAVLCAGAIPYALFEADGAHRGWLVALVTMAGLGGIGALLLPWDTIVRSRYRELAFMTWTVADFLLIAVVAAVDGGGESPLALAFFIPIVFTALSYPRWAVLSVGVGAVAGYVLLAVVSGTETGYALMFATALTSIVLMASWQARNHDRWRAALATASRTDPLTEALNRRGFEEQAAAGLAMARRDEGPLTLLLLDLDRFKAYNDEHGHVAGDDLLREASQRIADVLRPVDTVARIGGDEFAVLLPGADAEAGRAVADRVHETLTGIPHSLGLASTPPEEPDIDQLYRAADLELYAEKGRRRRAFSST